MATQPESEQFDVGEQIVRIRGMLVEQDKRQVEIQKLMQDIRLASPQLFFQGALAMAALIGAGAALTKLFF